MSERGETSFIKLPKFGAKMYDRMMKLKPIEHQITDIAQDLLKITDSGKLLDIGTGHGRLLLKIHDLNPTIELYGLDISSAMIEIAKKNLEGINAELSTGNIKNAPYPDEFFDIITSTGSFYLWNDPVNSVDQIHRILKKGARACIYETYKNHDKKAVDAAIKDNLKHENFLKRRIMPRFLKKQFNMTYSLSELEDIMKKTRFSTSSDLDKMKIGNLPAWVRITLEKK